jgi:hypothetical protein
MMKFFLKDSRKSLQIVCVIHIVLEEQFGGYFSLLKEFAFYVIYVIMLDKLPNVASLEKVATGFYHRDCIADSVAGSSSLRRLLLPATESAIQSFKIL